MTSGSGGACQHVFESDRFLRWKGRYAQTPTPSSMLLHHPSACILTMPGKRSSRPGYMWRMTVIVNGGSVKDAAERLRRSTDRQREGDSAHRCE